MEVLTSLLVFTAALTSAEPNKRPNRQNLNDSATIDCVRGGLPVTTSAEVADKIKVQCPPQATSRAGILSKGQECL